MSKSVAVEIFLEVVGEAINNKKNVKKIAKTFISDKRCRMETIEKLEDIMDSVAEHLEKISNEEESDSDDSDSDESSSSESEEEEEKE